MAESTLSISLFDLCREILRVHNGGEVYHTGTVSISSTTCTLTGGTFPTWITSDHVILVDTDTTPIGIASRDNATQLTLDTSAAESGVAYIVFQADQQEFEAVYDAIKAGLRMFYYPHQLQGRDRNGNKIFDELHQWSFLRPTQTIALSNADYDYDLPDDFGQEVYGWTFGVGVDQRPLRQVATEHLQAMQSRENQSDTPLYVAVRPKTTTGSDGQRFEALFYPTPDASYTVSYTYAANPGALTPTNPYPYAGTPHSDTIRMACLAAWAQDNEDEHAERYEAFVARLEWSVRFDQKLQQPRGDSYFVGTVTRGTYEWLQQEVGTFLDLAPNYEVWDHATNARVDTIIQRGLAEFYKPQTLDAMYRAHKWNFLRPLTTLTTSAAYTTGTIGIVSGVVTLTSGTFPSWAASGEIEVAGVAYSVNTRDSNSQVTLDDTTVNVDSGSSYTLGRPTYNLPSDFGGTDGDWTYRQGSGRYTNIENVSEHRVREMRSRTIWTGWPTMYAVYVRDLDSATGTAWQVTMFPTPDAAYQLKYRYRVNVPVLTAGKYVYGGPDHYETILASCLSIAEGKDGEQTQRYLRLLRGSIDVDRSEFTAEEVGRNIDPDEYEGGYDLDYYRLNNVVTHDQNTL